MCLYAGSGRSRWGERKLTKFTIHYERKVQVRQYEMLTIGLTQEFDTQNAYQSEALVLVANLVYQWIEDERERLGGPRDPL